MKFIVPIILLVLSIGLFFEYTNPAYKSLAAERALAGKYDTALTNARKLNEERDALNTKYRSISPDSIARLSKLLPDNADNIRLIIDIQNMAQSYGMSLSSIKFDATAAAGSSNAGQLAAVPTADVAQASKDYGVFNLQFTTTATYQNFQRFLKDIESSLRLTDIQSIDFGGTDVTKGTTVYTVKLSTYWLKG